MRNFTEWLAKFKSSISDYGYYVDFAKVHRNIDKIKVELNILNSLIGSRNIENDFEVLITRYPETLKCLPLLLAVRGSEIYTIDGDGEFLYSFRNMNYSAEQYKIFMRKTGLFMTVSCSAHGRASPRRLLHRLPAARDETGSWITLMKL